MQVQRAIYILMMIALLWAALLVAVDCIEVRGPVGKVSESDPYLLKAHGFSSGDSFRGFYYDIDNDIGTESLTLNIVDDCLEADERSPGAVYKSKATLKPFKLRDWGRYYTIGFLGENYFAGYEGDAYPETSILYEKSHDKECIEKGILLKVLRDNDSEMIVKQGIPVKLDEGYELKVRSVDIDGNAVYLELYKDGQLQNRSVVSPIKSNASVEQRTYCYSRDIGDIEDVVILAVHFENAFHGDGVDLATIDGIFQLSETARSVEKGSKYDAMTVSDLDLNLKTIIMDNRDRTIRLTKNRDIALMDEIRIKVANLDEKLAGEPLKFYVYKDIFEDGVHEIKGDVGYTVIGANYWYGSRNFSGFYYDLDDDLGTELLKISIQGENKSDPKTNYLDVTYRTDAKRTFFNFSDWGEYYAIGYMGEKYFTGYIQDPVDPASNSYICHESDDKNILQNGYISKILIDSDEEWIIGKGSTIELDEGYEIQVRDIDLNSDAVRLSLSKNQNVLDDIYIVELDGSKTPSYCYKAKLKDAGDVVTIALNFKNAFRGLEMEMVTINGIWQISDQPEKIERHDEIGRMTVTEVRSTEGEQYIEMKNEDYNLDLREDDTVYLMKDFYIKTADQEVSKPNPLRFYLYREAIIGGVDESDNLVFSRSEAGTGYAERTNKDSAKTDHNGQDAEVIDRKMPGFSAISAIFLVLCQGFLIRNRNKRA